MLSNAIISPETTSADETWLYRLKNLRIGELSFDFATVTTSQQFDYLLEQLSLPTGIIDFLAIEVDGRFDAVKQLLLIKKTAGTLYAIKQMCLLLGASSAVVTHYEALNYDGYALFDGSFKYDGGSEAFQYSVNIEVGGVADAAAFEPKLRALFDRMQPARLYLDRVRFVN